MILLRNSIFLIIDFADSTSKTCSSVIFKTVLWSCCLLKVYWERHFISNLKLRFVSFLSEIKYMSKLYYIHYLNILYKKKYCLGYLSCNIILRGYVFLAKLISGNMNNELLSSVGLTPKFLFINSYSFQM